MVAWSDVVFVLAAVTRMTRAAGSLAAHLMVIACAPLVPQVLSGAELIVVPERLELTGLDPTHAVVVSLVDDEGRITDVSDRVVYGVENSETAVVDRRGTVSATGDGTTTLVVRLDGSSVRVPIVVNDFDKRFSPSFKQDILPILTRAGCNTGACHGKLSGQNGFRLSLRGYAPQWDHDWITQEVNGRRIDLGFPDESLLLTKPSGGVAHEGGVRFRPGSRMWLALRDWVAARAPGPVADEPDAERLEVLPGGRVMSPGQTQSLLVRAHYADGRVRDVTWLAQFFSNDPNTVSVDSYGVVKAVRHGEAGVRVHFQGLVEVISFTMPFPYDIDPDLYKTQQNVIDGPLFAKLAELRIPPVGLCDDETFLRRVYLDAAGILPSPAEVLQFQADTGHDKRARTIDALLQRPEFTDYWTLHIADLLQNRKERDHDVRGQKGVKAFHQWLRQQIAVNRSWSDIARDVLLARGDVVSQPQAGYFITVVGEFRKIEESELPDSVAQSFLGTRIGCARCHNHPLERYTQDDFYHFAACFAKVNLDRQNPQSGASVVLTTSREEIEQQKRIADAANKLAEACLANLAEDDKKKQIADRQRELENQTRRLEELRQRTPGVTQPRTGKFMAPQPLDRVALQFDPGVDPRGAFVDWTINNEYFSGAMVNRLWKHFFSVGLVEPVDDLRASNPPSNPELWRVLNAEFRSSGFDLRHVIRLILNSRAYQLESKNSPENENDTTFYSHYYARRLPAEVLLDAIATATEIPNRFPGYPVGVRAIQVADPSADSYFLTLFGRSDRVTACACERKGEVTLPQLLHLSNDEKLVNDIRAAQGRLVRLLANDDSDSVTKEIFLATLSRLPSEAELATIRAALRDAEPGNETDQAKEIDAESSDRAPPTGGQEEVFADLFWALLNSKEFAFNH
jgi:hypothetical protein